MKWVAIDLNKQIIFYPKMADMARCLGWRVLSESVRFTYLFDSKHRKSLSLSGQCLWIENRGWGWRRKKKGNTAHSPSLNSSERRVANGEMGGRWRLQKQMCAQDPSGSQILSVWAKTLFCSRCCLWWLCGSVWPSLLPNHKPCYFSAIPLGHVVYCL